MPDLEERFKPTQIAFFQNPKDNISPDEVRATTGCNLAINCCYFDMSASLMILINGIKTRRPDGIFIWNDQIIRKEWNAAEGFGFDSNGAFDFGWSDQMKHHNFVYGDILIDNHTLRDTTKVAEGARRSTERTSVSVMPNGELLVYCTTDIISPAALQSRLAAKGAQTSLMLDGSLSTQRSCEKSSHKTARSFVPFWLCFWWGDEKESITEPKKEEKPMSKYTVCIDPGHGGKENYNGAENYREHEFALDLGLRLRDRLVANGVVVLMTRDEDKTVSLQERSSFANSKKPDYYVSLHSNASSSAATRGLVVYTAEKASAKANQLAQRIVNAAVQAGVSVFDTGLRKQNFHVLYYTNMPAVLIEYAFHTNATDRALLSSSAWRDLAADFTAKAICEQLGLPYTPAASSQPVVEAKPEGYDKWLECMEWYQAHK